jgi:hypothetical protein
MINIFDQKNLISITIKGNKLHELCKFIFNKFEIIEEVDINKTDRVVFIFNICRQEISVNYYLDKLNTSLSNMFKYFIKKEDIYFNRNDIDLLLEEIVLITC